MASAIPESRYPLVQRSRGLVAATWDLKSTESSPPEEIWGEFFLPNQEERVVPGNDKRTVVPTSDLKPRGKYQSLVKVFSQYQGQQGTNRGWPTGSGWLIRPDIVVTAGHVVYDHSQRFGVCTQFKAYLGYSGKRSVNQPGVQFRYGTKVVIPRSYLDGHRREYRDVAFVKLNAPFQGVTPYKPADTPVKGRERIGVVGYPGDKIGPDGEKAALAYEMFDEQLWNLETDLPSKLLLYQVSTFGGQSGGPVLRVAGRQLTPIGTHIGSPAGGSGKPGNIASTIGGTYGNPYMAYLQVFDKNLKQVSVKAGKTHSGVRFVCIPAAKAPRDPPARESFGGENVDPNSEGEFVESEFLEADQAVAELDPEVVDPEHAGVGQETESQSSASFVESLGMAAQLARGVDQGPVQMVGNPRSRLTALGPAATPITILANLAIAIASRLADPTSEAIAQEQALDAETSMPEGIEGLAERAVLCESALSTIMKMDHDTLVKSGIIKHMRSVHSRMNAHVRKISPRVLPSIMEPALRMAIMHTQASGPPSTGFDGMAYNKFDPGSEFFDTAESVEATELDPQAKSFTYELLRADRQQATPEFFMPLFRILKLGLRVGRRVGGFVGGLRKEGFEELASAIDEAYPAEVEALGMDSSSEAFYQALGQRALLGEAALEAALEAPTSTLAEAGFFEGVAEKMRVSSGAVGAGAAVFGAVAPLWASIWNKIRGKREIVEGSGQAGLTAQTGQNEPIEGVNGADINAPADETNQTGQTGQNGFSEGVNGADIKAPENTLTAGDSEKIRARRIPASGKMDPREIVLTGTQNGIPVRVVLEV